MLFKSWCVCQILACLLPCCLRDFDLGFKFTPVHFFKVLVSVLEGQVLVWFDWLSHDFGFDNWNLSLWKSRSIPINTKTELLPASNIYHFHSLIEFYVYPLRSENHRQLESCQKVIVGFASWRGFVRVYDGSFKCQNCCTRYAQKTSGWRNEHSVGREQSVCWSFRLQFWGSLPLSSSTVIDNIIIKSMYLNFF